MLTSSSNNWLLSLKIVLISTGVGVHGRGTEALIPVAADLVTSQVPSLWSTLLAWLTPPYLYILINCIIIIIVASSKLHPKPEHHEYSEIIPPPPRWFPICTELEQRWETVEVSKAEPEIEKSMVQVAMNDG
ncbi:hypothetical protein M0R45_014997 [Rubus argutus]|uniref:DUF4408 domain-containing protein n=1 Tax=Rubus argutus TaxID=59490 RepID=A0AAW1XQ00_RUBAR